MKKEVPLFATSLGGRALSYEEFTDPKASSRQGWLIVTRKRDGSVIIEIRPGSQE